MFNLPPDATLKSNLDKMEIIPAFDERTLELLKSILEQNKMILEQNARIVESLAQKRPIIFHSSGELKK